MNPLRFKLLVVWNIVLSTALIVVVLGVLVSSALAANDPPVKVYSATYAHGNGIAGNAVNDKTISSTAFADVVTIPVNFTGQTHVHYCVAIADARVINPASNTTGHRYEFGVGYDSNSAASYDFSNMTLEMSDNAGVDDPNYYPVGTNRVFMNLSAAAHTIRFQARKMAAGSPNLTIDNASMTVICFKKYQNMAASMEPDTTAPDNFVNDK